MHDSASIVHHDDKHIQHAKPRRRHRKEIDASNSLRLFSKNVLQDGEGLPRGRVRYLSTVVLLTVIPSLANYPIMRGVPQVGLA